MIVMYYLYDKLFYLFNILRSDKNKIIMSLYQYSNDIPFNL